MTDPIPAATVILYRPAPAGGPPEILMLERSADMAFAAGALVFPGGRVDPGDWRLAEAGGSADAEDAAARIAAIRETIEEAGVAVGLSPAPDAAARETLRIGLAEGADFGAMLGRLGLRPALDELTPFARWRPPPGNWRIFDTRFFIAEVAPDTAAAADGKESRSAHWITAEAALAKVADGEASALFPTLCTLHRIAGHADIAAARRDAADHPPALILTAIEQDPTGDWLAIPSGIGFPFTRQRIEAARRG